MNQEHLVVPKGKEMFTKKKKKKDGSLSKEHRSQPEGAPNGKSWNNLSDKIMTGLDYNTIE